MELVWEKLEQIRKDCPPNVKIIAVSKGQPAEKIKETLQCGQTLFGESYAQELEEKALQLKDEKIEWHFIGHLQRNKINKALPYMSFLHSIDSVSLAESLEKRLSKPLPCCIEVNLGDESSKTGIAPESVPTLVQHLFRFPKILLVGLMTIPPASENPEDSRHCFRRLRLLRDRLNQARILPKPLTELSMGMTHDYKVALEEGATMIRVGTGIFGERPQ